MDVLKKNELKIGRTIYNKGLIGFLDKILSTKYNVKGTKDLTPFEIEEFRKKVNDTLEINFTKQLEKLQEILNNLKKENAKNREKNS